MHPTRAVIPALLVLTVFFVFANFVVFDYLMLVFGSAASSWALPLGLILGFLSASFIIATILGLYVYNTFTRLYYSISTIWMGFFLYFFLAAVLDGIFVGIIGAPLRLFGLFLLLVAFVSGTYALSHAHHIIIKKLSITLPDLPEVWRGKKAIWISDLHLGQYYGSIFAKKVARTIKTLPHDILFIGGDLYDGTMAPDPNILIKPLKSQTASLGTYFITGNHEKYGNIKRFLEAIRAAGIKTLVDERIEIGGLQIIGVDHHNTSDPKRLATLLDCLVEKGKPTLLLKHDPKGWHIARAKGVALQLSGHTHHGQIWPINYVIDVIYSGKGYGLKRIENHQLYISSGVGTWGPPFRLGSDSEIVHLTFF